MKLDLGHNLTLPDAVLAQHMAVLGKTRSGKSSVLRLFVEALLERKERVCVLDPKGDWWGLKSSADGKRAGYGVVIFGGQRADIPLNQHAGASVAELVASGNRPCVIDLGGWMVSERTRFFIEFASTLFRSIDAPLRLVIDEVHNFAPQGKVLDPDAGKMLHWANRLASEGAGKGLVILSASQRPQKVHKDFLTCAETLVAMRVIHVLDRTAVKEWIDGAPDQSKGKEVLASLASMARGEGWVWSPEAGFGPEQVKFPMFRTYDSFKAPSGGQADGPLKGWAEVDLDDVRSKLAAVVEEAKANDPRELRKQIADLQRQLKAKAPVAVDPKALESAEARGIAQGRREAQAELQQAQRTIRDRDGRLSKIETLAHLNGQAMPAPTAEKVYQPRKEIPPTPERKPITKQVNENTGDLPPARQRILNALAWLDAIGITPADKTQLALFVGVSPTSGGYFNNLAALRSAGLIDYPQAGTVGLTVAGHAQASAGDVPQTTGDLHAAVERQLPPAKWKIVEQLIAKYPDAIDKGSLAELIGVSPTSGGYFNNLGSLRSLGLIDYPSPGHVVACPVLFLEGVR